MFNVPPMVLILTYFALLLAVIGLWFGRYVWLAFMALATILGYASGVLQGPAGVWIAAFAGVCFGYDRARELPAGSVKRRMAIGFGAFGIVVFSLALGMHLLPGFHNYILLKDWVLSSGAVPYTMYVNFDKTLVGVFIIGLCGQPLLRQGKQWAEASRRAVAIVPIHIALVAAGAAAIGYLTWQPKWDSVAFVRWAPVNLFFVCLSEEAFFRGFIQRELGAALRGTRFGAATAVVVSAGLFGLAHFGGGVSYVVLAAAAGLGYAIVYQRTRSIEMSMLAHFALNTVHFLLFTYPALQSGE